ncbi:MAG: hypothetical protein Q7P63_17500 [Verrucomicrobiota bacterium JB022]|nr:hypothetical protein [Verrucomicrobiota bacterium JB022]
MISLHQREHWDAFMAHHRVDPCPDCGGVQIVCEHEGEEQAHVHDHGHGHA